LIVVVLALSGGSASESSAAAAPGECVKAWNRDENALSFARHNLTFHGYDRAEVGYLDPSPGASVSDEAAAGECAVIFARSSLDPEPLAAGQVISGGAWITLDTVLPSADLARLQSEAFDGANVEPAPSGELVPLGSLPPPKDETTPTEMTTATP
jgi:hypothetical protein